MSAPRRRGASGTRPLGGIPTLLLCVALAIEVAMFAHLSDTFLTAPTATNTLLAASWLALLALGTTPVLATGAIDFSVMGNAAFAGVVLADVSSAFGSLAGIVAALAAGGVFGLVNGVAVVFFRVNPFLATLATGSALRGVCYLMAKDAITGKAIKPPFLTTTLLGSSGGIPYVFMVVLVAAVLAVWFCAFSRVGRSALAVGGNPAAARLAGIDPDRFRLLAYVFSGVVAAAAGVLLASYLGSGSPAAGNNEELTLFSAVLLGGTSLFGGRANPLGSLVAVLFVETLTEGLVLAGYSTHLNGVISGALLLISVFLTQRARLSLARRLNLRPRRQSRAAQEVSA